MNRLSEYIKAQTAVRDELTLAEVRINRGDPEAAIRHLIHAMRAVLTAQNVVAHMNSKRKPPRSKLAPRPKATPRPVADEAAELTADGGPQ